MPHFFGAIMSDVAAFSATYADWKLVKTRSVVQIVFEAPIEREAEVYAVLGGMPRAAEERWFAIARLNTKGTGERDPPQPTTADGSGTALNVSLLKEPASGHVTAPARKPSQDAFLLCNQPRGRVYLEQRRRHAIPTNNHINNVDEAKHVLRSWLDIESLSELDRDPAAADRWEQVEADYKTWLTAARYVEAP